MDKRKEPRTRVTEPYPAYPAHPVSKMKSWKWLKITFSDFFRLPSLCAFASLRFKNLSFLNSGLYLKNKRKDAKAQRKAQASRCTSIGQT